MKFSEISSDIASLRTLIMSTLNRIRALTVPYTASSPANWNNNPPTNVAAALDRIAQKITPVP